jgi:hypothetical protein
MEDLYQDGLRASCIAILEAANTIAETINAADEDTDVEFLWNTMCMLRSIAERLYPPQHEWPNDCEIYDFLTQQKVNQ